MAKERRCPHCGKNTRTTGDYCPWCSLLMVTTPDDNESNETPETSTEKKSIKKIIGGTTMKMKSWNWIKRAFAAITLIALVLFVYLFNTLANHPWEGIVAIFGLGGIIVGSSIMFLNETKKELPTNALKTGIWLNRAGATCLAIALIFGFFIPNFSPIDPVDIESEPTAIESETETESEPIILIPTTPSIFSSMDGNTFIDKGEYINSVLGERITWTNRKVVVPEKAWDEELSLAELRLVETTPVKVKINLPKGMVMTVFGGGYEQGLNRTEDGFLFKVTEAGTYEFTIRNGEIILWYPQESNTSTEDKITQEDHQQNDLDRIFEQIRYGNFDIDGKLSFFSISTNLLSKIPADLSKDVEFQIINDLTPVVTTTTTK